MDKVRRFITGFIFQMVIDEFHRALFGGLDLIFPCGNALLLTLHNPCLSLGSDPREICINFHERRNPLYGSRQTVIQEPLEHVYISVRS